MRAELDEIGEPVLLVGTSYGGAVITDAGIHPRVEQLVFVSAFPLEEGSAGGRARGSRLGVSLSRG